MSFRPKGLTALSTVLNIPKNITLFEKAIHDQTKNEEHPEQKYKMVMYQVISDIQAEESIKQTFARIKKGEILWRHKGYHQMSQRIKEQNDFIENPFEVEESIHTCRKCGSKRVFSYSKQVRAADEGSSVFCECVACRAKWVEAG